MASECIKCENQELVIATEVDVDYETFMYQPWMGRKSLESRTKRLILFTSPKLNQNQHICWSWFICDTRCVILGTNCLLSVRLYGLRMWDLSNKCFKQGVNSIVHVGRLWWRRPEPWTITGIGKTKLWYNQNLIFVELDSKVSDVFLCQELYLVLCKRYRNNVRVQWPVNIMFSVYKSTGLPHVFELHQIRTLSSLFFLHQFL